MIFLRWPAPLLLALLLVVCLLPSVSFGFSFVLPSSGVAATRHVNVSSSNNKPSPIVRFMTAADSDDSDNQDEDDNVFDDGSSEDESSLSLEAFQQQVQQRQQQEAQQDDDDDEVFDGYALRDIIQEK